MSKLADLQLLIQSLSKAEKRHFRLASRASGGDKSYLQLFDFYLRHPDADTKTVKQKFSRAKQQQLSVQNSYLYQRIMQSLKTLHPHGSIDFQIRELIQQAEILFDRELILPCKATLKRAEKLAKQFHRHTLMFDINHLQRKILLTKDGPLKASVELKEWAKTHHEAIEFEAENLELWRALIELGKGQPLSVSDLPASKMQETKNLQANILRLHIRFADAILDNKIEEGLEAISRLITLLELHPLLIEDDPNGYVTTINNKISILLYSDKKQEIDGLFERLHQLQIRYRIRTVNPSLNRQLLRSYNIELEYHREHGNLDSGLSLIPDVYRFIEKNKIIVPADYRVMIYYQFAFFCFCATEYRQSLQWVNKQNRISPSGLRPDIRIKTKLLNLCLLYQFNQLSALKYAVDNSRRYIKKYQLATATNLCLLKFFSRLCLLETNQVRNHLQQGKLELQQLPQTPDTRAYLEWIDHQI